MRELWVNGKHYLNVRQFLFDIGVSDDKQRSCYKPILHALKEGTGTWLHSGTTYSISSTAPAADLSIAGRRRKARESILAISRPRAIAEIESPHRAERRLLSRTHATFGLHQDRGDHYAEVDA
jgi:hypothetical protein